MRAQLFDQNWKFWVDKNAFDLVWSVPDSARDVTLPHDAMLEETPCANSLNQGKGAFRDGNSYTYVTWLTPSEEDRHRTLMLKFEGVYMNAKVYVNEEFAGKCPYGYSGFTVPLDGFLRYGEPNEIRVAVKNNGMPSSRWYSGGGIYRDVYLLRGGTAYIRPDGVQVTTEGLEDGLAVLRVRAELKNRCCRGRALTLVTRVVDANGAETAREITPVTLFEGEERAVTCRVTVPGARAWSAETPYLYTVETELYEGGDLLDSDTAVTGIRVLSLDAVHGLRVNGACVKLRGACIHHDSGVLGAATYSDAEHRRVRLLKEAGFNAVRMAHHPAAPALLRACDEVGMYVMDEAFDMWHRFKGDSDYALFFEECWARDMEAMVRKDYNHPSVLLYSVGNEIPEIGTPHGAKTCHDLCEKLRALDPGRYTLAAVNGVFAAGDRMGEILSDVAAGLPPEEIQGDVNDFMTMQARHMDKIVRHRAIGQRLERAFAPCDIAGYNYMTGRYEEDLKTYPNRILVGSETYPPAIAENWALVKKHPPLIGDFLWTGWDYLGEAGLGVPGYEFGEGGFGARFPCQLAYCGDFDITGFRRPLSYFHQLIYGLTVTPHIAVQRPDKFGVPLMKTPWILSDSVSSWTYPGLEGRPVMVEVYSAGDEVELLRDGESLGRRPAGEAGGYLALFETVYRPGTLEAVAYKDGAVLARTSLATAEGPFHLEAEAEPAGPEEGLIYIGITKRGANGAVAAHADEILSVTAGENVRVLGFGSGDPWPRYGYTGTQTKTFNGRALLVVQKTAPAAPAAVTIASDTGAVTLSI